MSKKVVRQQIEKCCPACGKYYMDKSTNYSKCACSPKCRHEFFGASNVDKAFIRKVSLRIYILKRQGVLVTDEERELIIKKLLSGTCEICGKEMPLSKLNIDHDHITNKIRGILCDNCNVLLGFAMDDTEILSSCINYLDAKCFR